MVYYDRVMFAHKMCASHFPCRRHEGLIQIYGNEAQIDENPRRTIDDGGIGFVCPFLRLFVTTRGRKQRERERERESEREKMRLD